MPSLSAHEIEAEIEREVETGEFEARSEHAPPQKRPLAPAAGGSGAVRTGVTRVAGAGSSAAAVRRNASAGGSRPPRQPSRSAEAIRSRSSSVA